MPSNTPEYSRLYRERNPEAFRRAQRRYDLKRQYGISPEDYDRMAEVQHGLCLICHRGGMQLVVDHDHETGRVRGLLCDLCNKLLGFAKDDPERLLSAVAYLSHPHNP